MIERRNWCPHTGQVNIIAKILTVGSGRFHRKPVVNSYCVERGFQFKKLSVVLGVLPILRLSNSEIELESGEVIEVDGSDGLTLNLTSGASYQLNKCGKNTKYDLKNRLYYRTYSSENH